PDGPRPDAAPLLRPALPPRGTERAPASAPTGKPATPASAAPAVATPATGSADRAPVGSSALVGMIDGVTATLGAHAVDVVATVSPGTVAGRCTLEVQVFDGAGGDVAVAHFPWPAGEAIQRDRGLAASVAVPLSNTQRRGLARSGGSVAMRLVCGGQAAAESAREPISSP
ncbi:MAG: hypothetical protein JSR18_16430, partial [Proteobacteria bacterium]|nr:hypothetical protein [Pseudomonadota bacterium]